MRDRIKKRIKVASGIILLIFFITVLSIAVYLRGYERSIKVEKDAYVSEYYPNTNFGSEDYLRVGNYSLGKIQTFYHFNISSLPDGWTEVYIYVKFDFGTVLVDIGANLTYENWDEMAITWNNKPNASIYRGHILCDGFNFRIPIRLDQVINDGVSVCLYGKEEEGDGYIQGYSKEGASRSEDIARIELRYLGIDPIILKRLAITGIVILIVISVIILACLLVWLNLKGRRILRKKNAFDADWLRANITVKKKVVNPVLIKAKVAAKKNVINPDLIQAKINQYHKYKPPPTIEKEINQYITLKLEYGRTFIYVNGKRFIQCIRLILNIQKEDIPLYDEVDSMDEAAGLYSKHVYQNRIVRGPMAAPVPDQSHNITPEQEFWGHCSNIQVWVEHDYDTRILVSNISFPLLRELTKAGDPNARKVYKEEIALRLESGYPSVVQYLLAQGYIGEFNHSEFQIILESNDLIKKLSSEPKIIIQFLITCVSKFPTLIEYILLQTLKLPEGKNFVISMIQFKPKMATFKPWIIYIPRYLFNLKNVLENLLNQVDENTKLDVSDSIQVIDQEVQYLLSQGYIVKPPREKGRIERKFKVVLLGGYAKKSRLLTKIATPNEKKNLPFNLFNVPIYLEQQNAKVNLIVWDISKEHYMLQFALKGADLALIVFDINYSSTLKEIGYLQNYRYKYEFLSIPKVLVGIKEDFESKRRLTLPAAEALSEKVNARYFETSLINGENIYRIFHKIAELVYGGSERREEKKKREERREREIKREKREERKERERKRKKREENATGDVITVQVGVLGASLAGRSLCYVDQEIVEKMGLDTGSIIEIKGEKKTAGIILSSVKDKGRGIIRLDGQQMLNAGVTIGEYITIKSAEEVPAEQIELTTTTMNLNVKKISESIFIKFLHKPVVAGDVIEISGTDIQKTAQYNPRIIPGLWMNFQKHSLRLIVKNTIPANRVVKIVQETRIRVNKQALK